MSQHFGRFFFCYNIIYFMCLFKFTYVYVSCENIQFSHMREIGEVGDLNGVTELFETVQGISVEICVEHCKRRSACSFINYRENAHVCFIIKHKNPGVSPAVFNVTGYSTGRKADWDMSTYGACGACTDRETCILDGAVVNCVITSCGAPTVPENAVLHGNIYHPGSNLVLRCADGTQPQQAPKEQITCLPNGFWSATSFACLVETTTTTTSTTTTTTTTTTMTPSTTTTTAPPFVCHAIDNTYRKFAVGDGTSVTYKLVQAAVTKAAASAACQSDGGELIKIVDLNRLNFVMNLMTCTGMFSHDIWIDGTWSGTGQIYYTTDGEVVPLDAALWVPNTPNSPSSQRCIRLIPSYSFIMDNQDCSRGFSYMCEIP